MATDPVAPVHVLLAVDANQVLGCAVSMRSILDHVAAGTRVRFHLMTDGVPATAVDALARTVEGAGRGATLVTYPIDASRFAGLMRSKAISHAAYARLLLDTLLPGDVTRCVYVDCDMIVRRDIAAAARFPLEGRTVAAITNGNGADVRDHQARLGLREARYFNSGFLVIDVARWRERDVSARALARAIEIGDRLILHDQDALNCALEDDWTELPREWNAGVNVSPWLQEDDEAVFHFLGAYKPWHADYPGRFADLFFRYLDRTAFSGWRPWNPLGAGAALMRARRAVPYLPAVLRALRGLVGAPRGAR